MDEETKCVELLDDDFPFEMDEDDHSDLTINEERREGFISHGRLNKFTFPDWD
jgi:hypothetical protein